MDNSKSPDARLFMNNNNYDSMVSWFADNWQVNFDTHFVVMSRAWIRSCGLEELIDSINREVPMDQIPDINLSLNVEAGRWYVVRRPENPFVVNLSPFLKEYTGELREDLGQN